MQTHPVFIRQVQGNKAMVITVVDIEELGLPIDNDMFVIASTESVGITGSPTITLDKKSLISSKKYVDKLQKKYGWDAPEHTLGMSISGIFKGPYWFIKKSKSVLEELMK